jgi:uncharacterized membrane protein YsdA (DUF1294 family)
LFTELTLICAIYFIVINIISIVVTAVDKSKAKHKKWRVPEKTLLILSAIGGAVGMYITMHLIHHKTKKMKFMVGIPAIFFSELLIVLVLLFKFR